MGMPGTARTSWHGKSTTKARAAAEPRGPVTMTAGQRGIERRTRQPRCTVYHVVQPFGIDEPCRVIVLSEHPHS